jgi:hypothetical protein
MATHTELYELYSDSALRNRVEIALVLVAETIRTEDPERPNHAQRLAWARAVFSDPQRWLMPMFRLLLAAQDIAQAGPISNASDELIVARVAEAVDFFAPEVSDGP